MSNEVKYYARTDKCNLECTACGQSPWLMGILPKDARAGEQCPCCFLPDNDCDGTLYENHPLWIRSEGEDALWHLNPMHCIVGVTGDEDSLTVSFQDGFSHRFTRQELDFSHAISSWSLGISNSIIAVELAFERETRSLASKQLRIIAQWKDMR